MRRREDARIRANRDVPPLATEPKIGYVRNAPNCSRGVQPNANDQRIKALKG